MVLRSTSPMNSLPKPKRAACRLKLTCKKFWRNSYRRVRQLRTPEEIRAWLDSLAQFSDKIAPLPETISREWIYQDHD
jgi:hypothetical protein